MLAKQMHRSGKRSGIGLMSANKNVDAKKGRLLELDPLKSLLFSAPLHCTLSYIMSCIGIGICTYIQQKRDSPKVKRLNALLAVSMQDVRCNKESK
jgi:hypothetical protein